MTKPRVSVLLTSYNHAEYLPLAVESLRAQTFQDFEVLALDDGSTDGSRDYLRAQSDLRVFCHEQNLGTYGNLNFGLGHAEGEFVAIFNDDDLWERTKLEKQVAALDADASVGLVHTGGHFIGPHGEVVPGAPLGFPWPKTPSGDVLPHLVRYNQIIASSVMFRRAMIEQTGGFDSDLWGCGDWKLWLRMAEVAHVRHLDEALTYYRVHANQACRQEDRMNEDTRRIRAWIRGRRGDWSERMAREPELRRSLAVNVAALGTELTWIAQPGAGRDAFWESITLDPLRWQTWLRYLASFMPTRWFRLLR